MSLFYLATEKGEEAERLDEQLPSVRRQIEIEDSRLSSLTEKINSKRLALETHRNDPAKEFLDIQFIDTTAEEMYLEAKRLESEGKEREALEVYLACISLGGVGNQQVNRKGSMRWEVWPSRFRRRVKALSEQYTEVGDALSARRETLENRFLEGDVFFVQFEEWKQLLELLGQQDRVLGFFDSFPKEEQSPLLALLLFDDLLAARRYEAAYFGKDYHMIRGDLERSAVTSEQMASTKPAEDQERERSRHLKKAIEEAAKGLEVLAGVKENEQALRLAKRLLEIDDSEETVELIRKHFERADQSRLFEYIRNSKGVKG